jgi:hypothetical protein
VLTPNAEQVATKSCAPRVDGFLALVGDRRANTYTSGMYSGKRHRCGFNIQGVGSHYGTPRAGRAHAHASDPPVTEP